MPRGNPKHIVNMRLDPALVAEAQVLAGPRGFTQAVEEGLRWWLRRQKRQARKATTEAETARRKAADA
jgi:hypothetical protein